MANKEYVFKRRPAGYRVAVHGLLLGTLLIIPSVLLAMPYPFIGVAAIMVITKLYYIKVIDFFFEKTIYQDDEHFYIKMILFKLKLNKKTATSKASFLVIENITVLSSRFTSFYGLVLVRNNESLLGRLSKNKVVLYAEEHNMDLEAIALEVSEMFEIDYIGRYM